MRTRRQHSSSNSVPRLPGDEHQSVLLQETISNLAIAESDVVVDATLGGGGHAREILRELGATSVFIGIDADRDALERAEAKLHTDVQGKTAHFVEGNFRMLATLTAERGIRKIDKALFDLGWSAMQLSSGRGFSFRADEPLLMTYASSISDDAITASRVVNEWSEETLHDIFWGFGEERYARRIAQAIVARRQGKPFTHARELADVIFYAVPPAYRRGRIHPATRAFQALRIAVNDELGAIQEGFAAAWSLLSAYGRIAIITFHSIEDRLVKNLMRERVGAGEGRLVVKRPIQASAEERSKNRRARSAKLRVIEKIVSVE